MGILLRLKRHLLIFLCYYSLIFAYSFWRKLELSQYQTEEPELNHLGLKPVTLTLDDTFASIGPLPQPLDYKTMREIALEDHAINT